MIKLTAIATAAAIACSNTPALCPDRCAASCTPSACVTTQLPESTPAVTVSAYAQEVVRLVNVERANAGLAPLTLDETLSAAAQIRAEEIDTSFSHTRPDGTSCFTVLKELGIAYRACGENIAKGSPMPQRVVQGWMNSSGHRANILNEHFTTIGVGVHEDAAGVMHWAQLFTA